MKKKLNLLMVIIFIASLNIFAFDQKNFSERSFPITKGGTLTVEVAFGNFKINTWEKDEIKMKVTGVSEEVMKELEVSAKSNELFISLMKNFEEETDIQKFEFFVPQKINLNLKTMSGDVNIVNAIDGSVKIDTYSGDIVSSDINGTIFMETKGGDISLRNINGACDVNTYGGDIIIGEITGGKANISTNGGDVAIKSALLGANIKTFGGDIAIGDVGGDSEIITYGGDIQTGNLKGRFNLETLGGDLYVKSVLGKISGKSNGGDITFGKVTGSIDVKTLAGCVTVELDPEPKTESKIVTNAGSIELIIKPTAKTTIEAYLNIRGGWKYNKDNYSITSDYPEKESKINEEDKNIVKTYELNGGGSKIILKNINDDITISKERKEKKQ